MATSRPFAYNPSRTPISGTEQVGDLAIAVEQQYYSEGLGGVRWWMGPDEDPGYIICYPFSAGTKPSPDGNIAYLGFKRSQFKTEESFVAMANAFADGQATFSNGLDAYLWLNLNGNWTSYIPVTPTPTPSTGPLVSPTSTPTSTPTPTITPSITPSGGDQVLINPIITENDEYIDVGNEIYLMFVDPNTPESSPTPTPTGTIQPTSTPTETIQPTPTPTVTPTETQTTRTAFNVFYGSSYGLACPSTSGTTIYGENPTWSSNTQFYNNPTGPVTIDMTNFYNYLGEVIELDSLGQYVSGVFLCPTPTPTSTQAPTNTPTPTESETPAPTPTPTITQTSTNTPTPSVTPQPVTGYSFNLVALPYNFPSSGNSIMNGPSGATSGSTDINALSTSSRGFYFNSIDSDSVDRTSYFSSFTGQNVTITFTQTGNTAIYSGNTSSFKQWIQSPQGSGFVFGTGVGVPPSGTPSGTAILIQSATTQYTIGLPVFVSLVTS